MTEIYQSHVEISSEADLQRIRAHARQIVERTHLGEREETRLLTIVSELARNILKYANNGSCDFSIFQKQGRTIVRATFHDEGPGIENVDLALADGYSTGETLGIGLPGVKRVADTFYLKSTSKGTVIEVEIAAFDRSRQDHSHHG